MTQPCLPTASGLEAIGFHSLSKAIEELPDYPLAVEYGVEVEMLTSIMRRWLQNWTGPEWRSFLNKASFLHEMEEVVVPLHCLLDFLARDTASEDVILVDLCAGKGFLAFCVAELANGVPLLGRLRSVVVLDKGDFGWEHFELRAKDLGNAEASGAGNGEVNVNAELWPGVNLFDASLPARLATLKGGVVIVGTHLCRRLSSRAVELFNLVPAARYLILAPCCIPNPKETSIVVARRSEELVDAIAQGCTCGFDSAGRRSKRKCGLCWKQGACWRCGQVGHENKDCPGRPANPCLGVVIDPAALWATHQEPFSSWVEALRSALSVPSRRIDAELRSPAKQAHDAAVAEQNPNNRYGGRRMSWIVAEIPVGS